MSERGKNQLRSTTIRAIIFNSVTMKQTKREARILLVCLETTAGKTSNVHLPLAPLPDRA